MNNQVFIFQANSIDSKDISADDDDANQNKISTMSRPDKRPLPPTDFKCQPYKRSHRKRQGFSVTYEQQSSWAQCAPDLLVRIESMLCQQSKRRSMKVMRLVNKHWCKALSESVSIMRPNMHIMTLWDIDAFQKRFVNVSNLALTEANNVSDAWLHDIVKSLPRLKTLSIKMWELRPVGLISDKGLKHINNLKYLTSLELAGGLQYTKNCIDNLIKLTQLQNLELDDVCLDDELSLQQLASFPKLSSLSLTDCIKKSDTHLSILSSLNNLKHFSVKCCFGITDNSFDSISQLKSLTYLDMRVCKNLKNPDFSKLMKLPLRVLDLMGCLNIENEGIKTLSSLINLRALDLRLCEKLTDDGLQCLESMTSLAVLRLGLNHNITNKCLQSVIYIPFLEQLQLCNLEEITNAGIYSLSSLKSLNKLTLYGCGKISNRTIEDLEKVSGSKLKTDRFGCESIDRTISTTNPTAQAYMWEMDNI